MPSYPGRDIRLTIGGVECRVLEWTIDDWRGRSEARITAEVPYDAPLGPVDFTYSLDGGGMAFVPGTIRGEYSASVDVPGDNYERIVAALGVGPKGVTNGDTLKAVMPKAPPPPKSLWDRLEEE